MRKLVRKAETGIWRRKTVLGGSTGPLAGSTDDPQPVVPVGLAGSTGGRGKDQPERDFAFLGGKTRRKSPNWGIK